MTPNELPDATGTKPPTPRRPSLLQLLKAVSGALVGVQSEQQRQQDFHSQSVLPFLIAGIIGTVLFVLVLLVIVKLVVG